MGLYKRKTPRRAQGFVGTASRLSGRCHAHGTPIQRTFGLEQDIAFNQRKQRVVLADTDIDAGVELGATLTHDDRASADQ